MPARSDDEPRVRGSRLCEIAGLNRQTRDKWVDRGLLTKTNECDQVDLVELIVLKLLSDNLKKGHVRIAWEEVRPKLREVVPGPNLTLVWDPQRRSAVLAFDPKEIVDLVRHGRLVQVLDIGHAIQWAREAFRREVAAYETSVAHKRRRGATVESGNP